MYPIFISALSCIPSLCLACHVSLLPVCPFMSSFFSSCLSFSSFLLIFSFSSFPSCLSFLSFLLVFSSCLVFPSHLLFSFSLLLFSFLCPSCNPSHLHLIHLHLIHLHVSLSFTGPMVGWLGWACGPYFPLSLFFSFLSFCTFCDPPSLPFQVPHGWLVGLGLWFVFPFSFVSSSTHVSFSIFSPYYLLYPDLYVLPRPSVFPFRVFFLSVLVHSSLSTFSSFLL
ncbi:hypothetical protein BJX70DRAFT_373969 [Aspergillus crustosus]